MLKMVAFKIRPALWERLGAKCRKNNLKIQDVMEELIKEWVKRK